MQPTRLISSPSIPTLADLLRLLGDVPPERVRYYPLPGTAQEQDVVDLDAHEDRLCELVDGVVVEKAIGFAEAVLGILFLTEICRFVYPRKLGYVTGAGGMMRLAGGTIRSPDVSFVTPARFADGRIPRERTPELAPDFAVEVLRPANTVAEMERKRGEYFASGTRLVWMVDPAIRTVAIYAANNPETPTVLGETDVLDGGDVLPGFTMELRPLFALLGA